MHFKRPASGVYALSGASKDDGVQHPSNYGPVAQRTRANRDIPAGNSASGARLPTELPTRLPRRRRRQGDVGRCRSDLLARLVELLDGMRDDELEELRAVLGSR
jgi:hypothetical protein